MIWNLIMTMASMGRYQNAWPIQQSTTSSWWHLTNPWSWKHPSKHKNSNAHETKVATKNRLTALKRWRPTTHRLQPQQKKHTRLSDIVPNPSWRRQPRAIVSSTTRSSVTQSRSNSLKSISHIRRSLRQKKFGPPLPGKTMNVLNDTGRLQC